MVVGIGLWFNRVCFELIIEYFRYNLTRLVCTNIMFAYEYAGNITFVAEFCQYVHFGCRNGAFVDDGIVYKTIGAIHGDVTVYQFPVLQRGEVIDDDARATGCDEYLYAFGLSGFQCFDGGSGNQVSLEAHQCAVNVKKQSFNHICLF